MAAVLIAVGALLQWTLRNHPAHRRPGTYYVATGLVGAAALLGGLFLVRKAIAPLSELRERLAAVRDGRRERIDGDHPTEVQPLVDDLNGLLEDRERAVARALATAADLAHGLKTPLAVLAQESEQAAAAGDRELAATLGREVERMRRQIDVHLARARAAPSTGSAPSPRCDVLPCVDGLVRTMRRLHAARELRIETDVSADHAIRGRREDLDEMLGNLIDNACKWARGRVAVSSSVDGDQIVVSIDDDGPGIEPALRDRVLQRGVRVDERAEGSGLGLAIASDLARLHDGSVTLGTSTLGGVRARLRLRRA